MRPSDRREPRSRGRAAAASLALAALALGSSATALADDRYQSTNPYRITRLVGSIDIDGALDEAAWATAPASGAFFQREPDEAAPPSQPTEVRVLYSERALYVAVRATDSDPVAIRSLLGRRDAEIASDWILVGIDSYNDLRTAFFFALNPAGVQRDFIAYDDSVLDPSWDAVWEGATRVDGGGWSAEFRIPYSQLRFSDGDPQVWGFQVMREIRRLGESDAWSASPRSVPQIVSRFGELRGLGGISSSRRIELLPYAFGGAALHRAASDDPLHDDASSLHGGGLDFKIGVGPSATIAGTINPDFGQVEADPSQVNLGAGELFLTEQRPFFLEGTEIFRFGITQGDGNVQEQLFYSRRIGAQPHGDGVDRDGYVDQPEATTIYGAAKLSGKTAGGWSFGLLEAVTGQETARFALGDGSPVEAVVVEPLTNFAVARLHKALRQGKTSIGAVVTAVNRSLGGTGLASTLHDQAYTGGLQATHRFADDGYSVDGKVMGSLVHGSPEALDATQTSSVHWFQRPDAGHIDYDPDRTALAGGSAQGSVSKISGAVRGATGFDTRTPGFEANDLGFQLSSDYLSHWVWLQLRDDRPGKHLRDSYLDVNLWHYWDLGGELLGVGGNTNGGLHLDNLSRISGGIGADLTRRDPGGLRGGPTLRRDEAYSVWLSASTGTQARLRASVDGSAFFAPASGSIGGLLSPAVTWQVASNVDLALGPTVGYEVDDNQYVVEVADGMDAPHYLMGRLRRTTTALTLRASYAPSSTLSIQLYAQPFVSTGRFDEYKEVVAPDARLYDDRYHVFADDELIRRGDRLEVDTDRDGDAEFDFEPADFDFRQLRSNLVVRWEYRPGSS
jgi:hypothetical protein